MNDEELREITTQISELKELVVMQNNAKNRPLLMQIGGTIATTLILASLFFLFGLPDKITATAEAKATIAIQHHNDVLEPRLRAIECNVTDTKAALCDIAKAQQAMGVNIAEMKARMK